MDLTIVTVLRSGKHLYSHENVESESIREASENQIARHISDRLRWHPELEIDRFVVIAGGLSWKVEVAAGHHELYRQQGAA